MAEMRSRLGRMAHPRLAVIAAVGIGLLLLGGVLTMVHFGRTGPRIGVVGTLLLLFAASGFLANAMFERA